MTVNQIIRAWTSPSYRASLTEQMPAHPAGMIELTGTALNVVSGGKSGDRLPKGVIPTTGKPDGPA